MSSRWLWAAPLGWWSKRERVSLLSLLLYLSTFQVRWTFVLDTLLINIPLIKGRWRNRAVATSVRIRPADMAWMPTESHLARNAPTASSFSIWLQGQSGNWLAISKFGIRIVLLFANYSTSFLSSPRKNRCQVVIKVCEDANKLAVDDSFCSECDARQLKIEYRPVSETQKKSFIFIFYGSFNRCLLFAQDKNKLPGGLTKTTGCIFCSAELSGLVEKRYAAAARNRGRGGGRGRGRGRRGRGRGRPKPKDKMAQLAAYFV